MTGRNFTLALSGAGLALALSACSKPEAEHATQGSPEAKRSQSSMAAFQALEQAKQLESELQALEQQRQQQMKQQGL